MMNPRRTFLLGMAWGVVSTQGVAMAQASSGPVVRLAELEIDAAQAETFRAASREHIQAALAAEPGMLAMHAVAQKDDPTRIRVLEIYVDAGVYRTHVQAPHFGHFRSATQGMIRQRTLHDTTPVRLGAKPRLLDSPHVRIAELEINPAHLGAYKAAVGEEIDDSIRLEPGVLAIYSVALSDKPNQLRFLEIYADDAAYRQHIRSPHFLKYVEATKPMIVSRKLLEATPIFLGLKPG
jgi:quinol monooxygenase YgiN